MPSESQTLADLFQGGGPVMWPLLAASILGLAVIVERSIYFARRRMRFEPFVDDLCEAVRKGDLRKARNVAVAGGKHPLARLAGDFLKSIDSPPALRAEILKREGGILLESAEQRLPLLRLVVQVAPILGLLGTVHGLLLAFWDLQAITGPIKPSDVAGGIGSALTTTVFGLSIAIPASAFLLMFEEQVERLARRMGFLVSHLEEALLEMRGAEHVDVDEELVEDDAADDDLDDASGRRAG